MKKNNLLFISLLLTSSFAKAQILMPVKWSYAAKKTGKNEAVVFLKATIDEGWHIYSQNVKDGGPTKTSFKFASSKTYTLVGKTSEPPPISKYEDIFKMNVGYFEKSVIFQQKIKYVKDEVIVKGTLEYGVCNDHQCLPPEGITFAIPVK